MQPATQRLVLVATVTLMILFVIGNIAVNYFDPDSNFTLNTSNQPTIGNLQSNVEVVVFLDPVCSECKTFNNTIFPKIKKEFIETNKIKYTVIPIASSSEASLAAEVSLCIFYQDEKNLNSHLFFTFLDYFYLNQPAQITVSDLLALAEKADPSININKVRRCAEKNVYYTRIRQNSAEASRVSSDSSGKPAIFINGKRIDSSSADLIFKALNESLVLYSAKSAVKTIDKSIEAPNEKPTLKANKP